MFSSLKLFLTLLPVAHILNLNIVLRIKSMYTREVRILRVRVGINCFQNVPLQIANGYLQILPTVQAFFHLFVFWLFHVEAACMTFTAQLLSCF